MERRRQLTRVARRHGPGAALALALALSCAPGGRESFPPEAARALAEKLTTGIARERVLVVDALDGAPLPFDVRQALITAGFRVGQGEGDAPGTVIVQFERATPEGDGWRVWTRRAAITDPGSGPLAQVVAQAPAVTWLVTCTAADCTVADSVEVH